MSTPGFRDLHRRMQIFVLLYVEGGSYLDEEDPKWEFVVLCVNVFKALLQLNFPQLRKA
jgi:hypothetical protein